MKKIGLILFTFSLCNIYAGDDALNNKIQSMPEEIQNLIAGSCVPAKDYIASLTGIENLMFDLELKNFFESTEFTPSEREALAIPFKKRQDKMIGARYLLNKKKAKTSLNVTIKTQQNFQLTDPNFTYTEEEFEYVQSLPDCIKEKFNAPEKVNVQMQHRPIHNTLKHAGKGLLYGFAAGGLFGLLVAYSENYTLYDTKDVVLIGGIGLGLAGALWNGTTKGVKEYSKRNLIKLREAPLYKKS